MANHKKYWKSTAELDSNNAFVEDLKGREFVEKLPEDAFLGNEQAMNDSKTNRRDFLKYVGFSKEDGDARVGILLTRMSQF